MKRHIYSGVESIVLALLFGAGCWLVLMMAHDADPRVPDLNYLACVMLMLLIYMIMGFVEEMRD